MQLNVEMFNLGMYCTKAIICNDMFFFTAPFYPTGYQDSQNPCQSNTNLTALHLQYPFLYYGREYNNIYVRCHVKQLHLKYIAILQVMLLQLNGQ